MYHRKPKPLRPLTIKHILHWADRYHRTTGHWPLTTSAAIAPMGRYTWSRIDSALRNGQQGLPGGSSLSQLLCEQRGIWRGRPLPPLTDNQIGEWARAHYRRTDDWPTPQTGPIPDTTGETWAGVDVALREGRRGLPGGSSLDQFLVQHCRMVKRKERPTLTHEQILTWADAHYQRAGEWPTVKSGPVPEQGGLYWRTVNLYLRDGYRGLPMGSSLARLLAERRGVCRVKAPESLTPEQKKARALRRQFQRPWNRPPLDPEQIKSWAVAHFQHTGRWPSSLSGPIDGAPEETWSNMNNALRHGLRGLAGGTSLARLLAEIEGKRFRSSSAGIRIEQILAWADAHHERTGRWPTEQSGPIPEAAGRTWKSVSRALHEGYQGLPKGSSLARLLARERGINNAQQASRLSKTQIWTWAKAYHRRTGLWPTTDSGLILEAPGESWKNIDAVLYHGWRGLPGCSSLAQLLAEFRRQIDRSSLPPLTVKQILRWADAYRARTGQWPTFRCGRIPEVSRETWRSVSRALSRGERGLPGGSSLAKLLVEKRGRRKPSHPQ